MTTPSLISTFSPRRALWPLLLGTAIVFASGWQVAPATPFAPWMQVDKLIHFFVFGLLATLIARSFPPIASTPRALLTAFLLTTAFGCADELHQATNAVRMFSVADALADMLGAGVALLAYRFWPTYRRVLEQEIGTSRRDPRNESAT